MTYRAYDKGDELVQSDLLDVKHPSDKKHIVNPQVIIVPLVGFTKDCRRIGYGRGLYEKTIQKVKNINGNNTLVIGVGLEAQKFDDFNGLPSMIDVENFGRNRQRYF